MHERRKVLEAEIFLKLMQERSASAEDLRHSLSAFLSAARSTLQYALEEARARGRQTWYENAMRASPVLGFFKGKRDINVHVKPLVLMQQTTLTEMVHVNISESLLIKIEREDGTTETREVANAPRLVTQHSSSRVEVQYLFGDWLGTEDVLALSQKYIAEVRSFVEAGVNAGYISG